MVVNQQEILLSELRAILIKFITKIDINKRTDTEKKLTSVIAIFKLCFQ